MLEGEPVMNRKVLFACAIVFLSARITAQAASQRNQAISRPKQGRAASAEDGGNATSGAAATPGGNAAARCHSAATPGTSPLYAAGGRGERQARSARRRHQRG